ncbi:Ubiquitin carboxyl-terminal hydrolase [Taphrina deformans PYCC 5710]|uniref:Ubiquitin carboxyl-terminal hydrolase n=1 Tax=Taphrina deformans (strain PYCC 5710 / ATCC 11124 / CBS 356.35 / IMI 108563 / JCM 9778 / NBRC 8474) TaxID=1097556 RepID=R4X997_TAPDE|nr:Ubiquitin carboxyl-terminal hydrolase [Taphrina deformans PYCC 5710]|eukprot:CCG82296.1 Ubiquitin carboxyl-terminal hydrolase [Taphrina deformans PYCC 5710]
MSSAESQYFTIIGLTTAIAVSLYFLIPFVSNMGSVPKGPVVPGLRNWANWCFANSAIQSLASLPSFRRWLDQELSEPDTLREKTGLGESEKVSADAWEDAPLSRTMRGMIEVLNIEGPSKILSASPLVKALETLQESHISRSQQDAQEFLHMLLESIAAEQNNLPVTESLQQMSIRAAREGRRYKALPFEGAIKSVSTCTDCRHELRSQTNPFLELTILPPQRSSITLGDCIAHTLQSETIEDYNCVHCQIALLKRQGRETARFESALAADSNYDLPRDLSRSHVTLERRGSISRLPEILILHINRSLFGAYATRNAIDVTYTETLTLDTTDYALRSFVIHRGSHDRGHYIAYRRKSGRWYAISDETVRVVDGDTVLGMGGSTFLMFYERIDHAAKEERSRKRRKRRRRNARGERSGTEDESSTLLPKSKI